MRFRKINRGGVAISKEDILIAAIASQVVANAKSDLETYKQIEQKEINAIKNEISRIRTDLSTTIIELQVFSKNDKNKIDDLEDDYLSLISQITTAHSKLDFIEAKISDRFTSIQSNVDNIALINDTMKSSIRDMIRSIISNRRSLKLLSKKTIGGRESTKELSIDLSKSLKENLLIVDNILLILKVKMAKFEKENRNINRKLDVLLTAYKKEAKYRLLIAWCCGKIKLTFNVVCKYTIRSTVTRIVFYLFAILGFSPRALEVVEYIGKILGE